MGVAQFKKLESSLFAKIVYVAIAVSFFLGFGVLSSIRGCEFFSPSVKVAGEKVDTFDLLLVLRDIQAQGFETERQQDLFEQGFSVLVSRRAVAKKVEEWGMTPPMHVILTAFLGNENPNLIARNLGVPRQSLEKYLFDLWAVGTVQNLLFVISSSAGQDFSRFLTEVVGAQRQVIAGRLSPEKIKMEVPLKEARVFWRANEDKFIKPEVRDIWIAKFPSRISAENFIAQSTVFNTFDEFKLAVNEMGGVASQIKIGKNKVTENLLPAFRTPEREFSAPVSVGTEWWVFWVAEVEPERKLSFEDVKDRIISFLKLKKFAQENSKVFSDEEEFKNYFRRFVEGDFQEERVSFGISIFLPQLSDKITESFFKSSSAFSELVLREPDDWISEEPELWAVFYGKKLIDWSWSLTQVAGADTQRMLRDFMTTVMAEAKIEPASVETALRILGFVAEEER